MEQGSRVKGRSSCDLWEPSDQRLLLEAGMRVGGGALMTVTAVVALTSERDVADEWVVERRTGPRLEREKECEMPEKT